jgi:hypothetical protein
MEFHFLPFSVGGATSTEIGDNDGTFLHSMTTSIEGAVKFEI